MKTKHANLNCCVELQQSNPKSKIPRQILKQRKIFMKSSSSVKLNNINHLLVHLVLHMEMVPMILIRLKYCLEPMDLLNQHCRYLFRVKHSKNDNFAKKNSNLPVAPSRGAAQRLVSSMFAPRHNCKHFS